MEILITSITLIIIAILGNVLSSQFDPLEWIKNRLGIGTKREIYSKYFIIDTIIYTFWKLLNCNSCLSYWITVIYFLPSLEGFYLGLISYTISHWLYNKVFTTQL